MREVKSKTEVPKVGGVEDSILILVKCVQYSKALLLISAAELTIVTEVKPEQFQKAFDPRLVTELDIVTEVKPEP